MKYKEDTSQYNYTMAQHSLGVALGKTNQHIEAIRNFDEIIKRELEKPYGPSRSLVIAARTKKISLQRTNAIDSSSFLDEIIEKCETFNNGEHIIEELIHIRDEE